jgi:dCTP diphosphatase
MSDIADLTKLITKFTNERDWEQFHKPKDLAISLMLEAAEVAEHFQWKNDEELKKYFTTHKTELGEELADVLYWVLLISHDAGIDLRAAFEDKMKKNAIKYPIKKSKGKHTKYTDL